MASTIELLSRKARDWHSLSSDGKRYLAARAATACSFGLVAVLLNLYFYDLGLGTGFMGLSLSIFSASAALASIPAGLLADRYGGVYLMIVGQGLAGCSILMQVITCNRFLILAGSLVAGVGSALSSVGSQPHMASVTTARSRQLIFSASYAVFMGMGVVGNLLAGMARHTGGGAPACTAFRGMLLLAACLNFAAAVILAGSDGVQGKKMPETRASAPSQPSDTEKAVTPTAPSCPTSRTCDNERTWPGTESLLSRIRGIGNIVDFVGIRFFIGLGAGLSIPFFNIYFKSVYNLSTPAIGIVFGLQSVIAAALTLSGPGLVRRWGRVRSIVFLRFLSIVMLMSLAAGPFLPLALLCFWARAATARTATPLFSSLVMDRVDRNRRGLAASLTQTTWQGARALASFPGGYLIESSGFPACFVFTCLCYGIATFWLYSTVRDDSEGHWNRGFTSFR